MAQPALAIDDSSREPEGLSAFDTRRDAILDAAARLFMERGYAATSVRDLAREAGISQATLYYYIKSKGDALIALHNAFHDELLSALSEVADSDLTAAEKLKQFIHRNLLVMSLNRSRRIAFFRERHALEPEVARQIQAKRDQVDRILDQILDEGMATGEFRPMPVKTFRLGILGMLVWASGWFDPRGALTPEELSRDFFDLALRGVAAPPAAATA
jgi:TetR/AcrR family transcriptional regulator, cholesterol catabolism regulator